MVMVNSVNIRPDTTLKTITDTSYYIYGNDPELISYNELQFIRNDSSFLIT